MISVVVCTRNRAASLRTTLRSLAELRIPEGLSWEVVVVDNNSTDDTSDVVGAFARTSGLNVRYVLETTPGLSFARNRGVAVSRGEIVACTDDDCLVDTDWLAAAAREFSSDTSISVLTGRVELHDLNDSRTGVRTHRVRTTIQSLAQLTGLTIGCNMMFTRRTFDEVGEFDRQLGAGTTAASAEDTDFLYRAYKRGLKIVYSPDVLLHHNHGRRTEEHVQACRRRNAMGRGAFYCKYIMRGDIEVANIACKEVVSRASSYLKGVLIGQPAMRRGKLVWDLAIGARRRLRSRAESTS
jgi:glycosyltransferase involved in cell wall biosynthesis